MAEMTLPDRATVPEAARFLAVSTRTIHIWIRFGSLPSKKVGGRWLIDRQTLLDFRKRFYCWGPP